VESEITIIIPSGKGHKRRTVVLRKDMTPDMVDDTSVAFKYPINIAVSEVGL